MFSKKIKCFVNSSVSNTAVCYTWVRGDECVLLISGIVVALVSVLQYRSTAETVLRHILAPVCLSVSLCK